MKPYYEQGGITIYHGDCLDVLPTVGDGVVVTDPPYGIGVEYDGYRDSSDALDALIQSVWGHLGTFQTVALTPGVGNIHKWPRPAWTLCWFTPAGVGSGPWGFCTWQPIFVYGRDPYLANGLGRRPDGIAYTPKGNPDKYLGHPCPKPVDLMHWIIQRVSTDMDDLIIDPFMGSGTTLRAAKNLGRRAIGIDQSERYCEIAANRLSQGVLWAASTEPGELHGL